MIRGAFDVVVCLAAILASGCAHTYVVSDAVVRELVDTPPAGRVDWVIAAQRPDGTRTSIWADSVLLDRVRPVSPTRTRVVARRGLGLTGAGVALDVLGALMVFSGVEFARLAGPNDDQGLGLFITAPLLALGVGAIGSGVVLTCVGATRSPEVDDLTPTISPPHPVHASE